VRLRALAAGVLGAAAVVLLGGCANFAVLTNMDAQGSGRVTLTLSLDQEGQAYLGMSTHQSQDEIRAAAQKHFPWVRTADGWREITTQTQGSTLVLQTSHDFASVDDLETLMSEKRDLRPIGDLSGIEGMPQSAPILNDLSFRLSEKPGKHSGYSLFAQGGVGDVPDPTCAGDRGAQASGQGALLRDGFRFGLPTPPADTSGQVTSQGLAVWDDVPFGDCPRITASSSGGTGSDTIAVNGLILGGLALFILLVLGLRAFRRRGAPRA
jgi:hypothetical protein